MLQTPSKALLRSQGTKEGAGNGLIFGPAAAFLLPGHYRSAKEQ